MNTNIFEVATRQKIRFTSTRGQIGVEDLWDLPLEELDKIANGIDKAVESSGKSFIKKQNTADKKLTLRLEVVVSVINTKLEEQEKRKTSAERKAKRDQLLGFISQKENLELSEKSLAELKAEYEKLEPEEIEA